MSYGNYCKTCTGRKISYRYNHKRFMSCGCPDGTGLRRKAINTLNQDTQLTKKLDSLFQQQIDISYLEQLVDLEVSQLMDELSVSDSEISLPDIPSTCPHDNVVESCLPVSGIKFFVCRDCKQEVPDSNAQDDGGGFSMNWIYL